MADFEIEALLQKTMGLKVTSIGKSTLERSVQRRMRSLSIDDRDAYVQKLLTSAFELKELIEKMSQSNNFDSEKIKREALEKYSSQNYYNKLMEIFKSLI